MQTTYLTCDGDVLDGIVAAHYGTENLSDNLVAVLDANRDLAACGAVYPAGLTIILPDLSTPVATPAVQLWD